MSTPPDVSDLQETPPAVAPSNPDRLPTWEIIALAVGDLIALILFVIVGRESHQMEAAGFVGTINAAMPFVTAWLITAAVLGAFSGKAMYPLLRVIGRTLLAGIVAGPIGVLLRAALLGRMPAPMFFLVATGFTALMLLGWRMVWSRVRRLWWPELP
jgi:hypothetical protein